MTQISVRGECNFILTLFEHCVVLVTGPHSNRKCNISTCTFPSPLLRLLCKRTYFFSPMAVKVAECERFLRGEIGALRSLFPLSVLSDLLR